MVLIMVNAALIEKTEQEVRLLMMRLIVQWGR
jgi:hypothetical protein